MNLTPWLSQSLCFTRPLPPVPDSAHSPVQARNDTMVLPLGHSQPGDQLCRPCPPFISRGTHQPAPKKGGGEGRHGLGCGVALQELGKADIRP